LREGRVINREKKIPESDTRKKTSWGRSVTLQLNTN